MPKPDKKLFLLDAMALIYRAHFAFSKNPRINSKGLNTGAVFGFANTLLEIIQKEKPTHLGVAFDTDVPTFRHVEFPEYKAQREATPEDIKIARPLVKQLVEAFQVPILELDGFEADDVIGTLAKKASAEGFEVFMMTPDKDYGQLVEDHVYLYKPAFMGNAVDVMGIPEVLAKWDIERIDQVTDMLGLQGDAVDNIPGIPGVGPKTASKLLKEYGSIENLVANAEALKGKLKERVMEFGEQGIFSKKLATIHTEVPIEFNAEALVYTGPKDSLLQPLLDELEFRGIRKRIYGETDPPKAKTKSKVATDQMDLFAAAPAPALEDPVEMEEAPIVTPQLLGTIETVPHQYHLMDTVEKRQLLLACLQKQSSFCFDTETDGLDAFEAGLVGLSFSWRANEAYYVPVPEDFDAAKTIAQEFATVLENVAIEKVGQNLKYDILVLRKYDIEVLGPLYDTMLAHYLLEPEQRHGMDMLSEHYLQYSPVSISSLIGPKGKKQKSMRDIAVEEVAEYAAEDADVTWQLKEKLAPELPNVNMQQLYEQVEVPLVPVLAEMEFNGITVGIDTLKELSEQMEVEARAIEQQVYEHAGMEFNLGSPKQLGEVLFDRLKITDKAKKTKTGQYATGEDVLSKLADKHPLPKLILEFRELTKLKSTYIDALPQLISPRDGRVHTSFNQAVTATGRLSSTGPNLQNIPIRTARGREIRKAFVARGPEFKLLAADYSQVELRIMASFAKDESMIEAFRQGKDIHTATAAKIYKVAEAEVDADMRRKAKTANFGIIYGISAFGLAERLSIPRGEASELIKTYFEEFPAVKAYMDRCIEQARELEYVETILGRRRYLRDINSRNQTIRGFAERNAINAPIQGSAADIIKLAMVNIYRWMKQEKLKSKMLLQVHDELVFDMHLSEEKLLTTKVQELMANAHPLEVPLEVGIGTGENWLEAH